MGVIERLTVLDDDVAGDAAGRSVTEKVDGGRISPAQAVRERIVRRTALELADGDYVNLGIGDCLALS